MKQFKHLDNKLFAIALVKSEVNMFSVFFEVDANLGDEHDLILGSESEYIIGEGKNIEEAFASVRAQIELSNSELPWKMTSIKYQSI